MHTDQMVVYGHGVTYLSFSRIKALEGVRHGFSTRDDDFAAHGIDADALSTFALELGFAPGQTVVPQQVHGADVMVVKHPHEPFSLTADALITQIPGLALGVQVADCVPVFLADRQGRAVGVVHAGWRGLVAQNVYSTVRRMLEINGNAPGALVAQIGPAVCSDCFLVQDDVAVQFGDEFIKTTDEGRAVDLKAVAVSQLQKAGIPLKNITVTSLCTICRGDMFYSFRQSGGPGRQLAMIGLA